METLDAQPNIDHWEQWQLDCQSIGAAIDAEKRAQFEHFYALLDTTNRSTNLIRYPSLEGFLTRHLMDSLSLCPFLPEGTRVLDVGSGAGFPVIPLAIARPDLEISAVEATGKKCAFMQSVKEALKLDNLRILNERSETLAKQAEFREAFPFVTSRAVAALPALLELALPFLIPSRKAAEGRFFAMKGLAYEEEMQRANKAMAALGARLKAVHPFEHPGLVGSRLLEFEKNKPTPLLYPRPAGMAVKKPL